MREFVVKQTSLNLKWTFERMLPSLPGPGTEAFSKLAKALHPYGINPSMVMVDAPSSRLGDVTLTISKLLEGRLGVRITCNDVEFFLDEYLVDDDEKIALLLNEFFTALKVVNEEANKGSGFVKSS